MPRTKNNYIQRKLVTKKEDWDTKKCCGYWTAKTTYLRNHLSDVKELKKLSKETTKQIDELNP